MAQLCLWWRLRPTQTTVTDEPFSTWQKVYLGAVFAVMAWQGGLLGLIALWCAWASGYVQAFWLGDNFGTRQR